ncbi:MAG: PEP-CTERM sorting domain-containing protein, partial [Planctomycetota bacterium]
KRKRERRLLTISMIAKIRTDIHPAFAASFSDTLLTFMDVTGSYVPTSGGDLVTFSYTNLMDTGGANGTFSGNFSFVIPEPGSVLLVAATGLLLGCGSRRRRKA